LHLLDFGGPESGRGGFLARIFHSSDRLRDNAANLILSRMSEAGFANVEKVGDRALLLGRVVYYRASAPILPAHD